MQTAAINHFAMEQDCGGAQTRCMHITISPTGVRYEVWGVGGGDIEFPKYLTSILAVSIYLGGWEGQGRGLGVGGEKVGGGGVGRKSQTKSCKR